jgi:hypothetical protein
MQQITVIRWSARVLWVILMGVFLPFLGEGTPGNSMGPLAAIWFGLVGIYAVAMFLALKWERAAVPVGVAALLAAHVDGLFLGLFEYPGHLTLVSVVNPFLLVFWVPVLLYLRCWRLEGRARRKAVL